MKRSKGRERLFKNTDFYFDENALASRCPASKEMGLSVKNIVTGGRQYVRFSGYLKDCRACPLQSQCMRKGLSERGRQVQFEISKGY